MKFVLVLATLALSALAQATPAVGDTSTFVGTMSNGQQSVDVTVVISLTQFDATKNAYLETQTVTASNGKSQSQQGWMQTSQLLDDATIQQILANCPGQGGTLESLTTPAGTFNTCRLVQDDTTFNVGAVPFGILKQVSPTLSISLSSFASGTK